MVIMGRKTFESIGKPLPGRLNIVLSRSKMNVPEIRSFTDFPAACAFCSEQKNWPEKVFIIGGATLYAQTLEQVSEIYLTKISREISGDVFYPELNISNFQIEKMKTVQCEDASLEFFHYVKV